MNKKISIIIWSLAVLAILVAASTFYSKNKDRGFAKQPQQTETTGSDSQETDTSSAENSNEEDSAEEDKVMAPDFSLKNLDGETVKLSDYRGKIVILNFWATWCKYCLQEMPDFNELNKELEKENDAAILAVNVQESKDTITEYLSSENINLNVLLDQDGSVAQTYGISGFPNTFIINKDGSVYGYIPGKTDRETLEKILEKAKKGEPIQ